MARRVIIVGGGAAGIFAAVRAAELAPDLQVTVLEKNRDLLQKVAISGGGRCNVTHDCRDPRELIGFYPRGRRELRGMFARFAAQDTIDWFESRGVPLKTESDGRMFPTTDDSTTVIECLLGAARIAHVEILTRRTVVEARHDGEHFEVLLQDGAEMSADRLLVATGGMRGAGSRLLATAFGHTIAEPVPSLFTFHIQDPRLKELAGLAVPDAAVRVVGEKNLTSRGPLLVTPWGLSGPGVLKLSALGARRLAELDYAFELQVDWLPDQTPDQTAALIAETRRDAPRRHPSTTPLTGLPRRLWERMTAAAGIPTDRIWAELRRDESHALVAQMRESRFHVDGKSLNKDEFVTCGGVPLKELDLRRMESKRVPGLHFAGEMIDIDGVTGGFNLQAAWTGGWIAGEALAGD